MLVLDCTSKIKDICDALGFINATMDEDEMVKVCLREFAQMFESFQTVICTKNMDRDMGGTLPMERLDRMNYTSWEYKMH